MNVTALQNVLSSLPGATTLLWWIQTNLALILIIVLVIDKIVNLTTTTKDDVVWNHIKRLGSSVGRLLQNKSKKKET